MENIERIDDWRGQDVLDSNGEKIGKVDEVFHATGSGQAEWVSVKSGLLGRRNHLVPLLDASIARDYIRLAFDQEQIERAEGAPNGPLDAAVADRLSAVYGVQPRGVDYESASLIAARREEADEAIQSADELEALARERITEAQAARQAADEAARRAEQAEREEQRAREDAETARAAADTLNAQRRD